MTVKPEDKASLQETLDTEGWRVIESLIVDQVAGLRRELFSSDTGKEMIAHAKQMATLRLMVYRIYTAAEEKMPAHVEAAFK